mgnify:CR=1 FL=1
MAEYDLFIIGGGPAGYAAGIRAAKLGLKTGLAEERELGGTCLNRGCIPTKTLLHAASVLRQSRQWPEIGITADHLNYDIDKIYERVEKVVALQENGLSTLLEKNEVDVIPGHGRLEAPHKVSVNREIYDCKAVLLATGSAPSRLHIPGAELEGVFTSDDLLRAPAVFPSSLTIIGGGVIGCELASFYADLGCEVTILEAKDRLLPLLDADLGSHLEKLFRRRKIKIRCNAFVESIEKNDEGRMLVRYQSKKKERTAEAEGVLLSTGRVPYYDGLFAPGLSPEKNGPFIEVDAQYQTSLPGVYAAGDLIGGAQLAHEAEAEGQWIAYHLAGSDCPVDPHHVPSAIYTEPEIAAIGPTEAELKAAGIAYKAGRAETLGNARCLIDGTDRGFVKILAEKESSKLLAVHMIAPRASDLIVAFTPFIANERSYKEILRGMRPHPSFSEVLTEALEDLDGEALHSY